MIGARETPRERRRGKMSRPFAAERGADMSDTREKKNQRGTENLREEEHADQ